MISKGGRDGTVVDPKLIFKEAIECTASGIILCHNHPSGNIKPSDADISLNTQIERCRNFTRYSGVSIILIIAGNSYFSFADEGRCIVSFDMKYGIELKRNV